ncbi:hypothetical protein EWM64_g1459 [Hericium alpestre]|uniref:Uncharacterized protein n=1 Tax=Hericium alpestre TaxID=135208 RepID=A0A4Z0A8F4_9AGAM|nr:hypothetical protein EWM64_g1459 [Hericium alpestre]
MSLQSNEQVLHDRINLSRLVKRLEKAVDASDWADGERQDVWMKSQGMLQKLKYARTLLKNVEFYDEMEVSSRFRQRHEDLRKTIERLESAVETVNARTEPKPTRPASILSTLPLPPPSARGVEPSPVSANAKSEAAESSESEPELQRPEMDLLLGPADDAPLVSDSVSTTLLPPTSGTSPSSATSAPSPAFLQNSAAVQEEMSAQLAQMAGQLRRNAIHFSEVLAKDQAVMGGAEEKIGANYDVMKKERVRLRDHRGKSLGTTCLTLTSVFVVAIAFIIMFFVIRIT